MSIWIENLYLDNLINDININIAEGAFCVINGKNGSGKTSFIKLLYGDYKSSFGKCYVLKNNVFKNKYFLRKNIGIIFEDLKLFKNLTVIDNIKIILKIKNIPEIQINKICNKFITWSGIQKNLLNCKIQSLSKLEKQKIALIRALIIAPKILLIDSPILNVEFLQLLNEINKSFKTTIILTTDDAKFIQLNRIECTKIFFMSIYQKSLVSGVY